MPAKKKGFTLTELMVVIIIIGILSAIAAFVYKNYVSSAKATEGQNLVKTVAAAAQVYYSENNNMPPSYSLAAGSIDSILNVNPTQNKFYQSYTFTKNSNVAYTVTAVGAGAATGITVTLDQPDSGAPTVTVTGGE